ncbi:MAG TPA: hypothetical protein VK087_03460 [Tissierellaceae bacterium]|nr:hypothetical protein [Tissierellaceae bacterium]
MKGYFIEKNKKAVLKNYYSREMRKGKTYKASFMDKFLFTIVSFIILFIILLVKSQKILLSFYFSGLVVFFTFNLLKLGLDKRKQTKIDEINQNLKKKKLIRELSHLNKDGFIDYVKELLEEFYEIEIKEGKSPLDLTANIDKETCGIRCYKISMEDRVRLRDLERFEGELGILGVDKGIVVTNSYFRDEVYEESNITFYDLDGIIKILKKLEKYPSDEDMEEYILDRFMNKRNNYKKEITEMSVGRIIQLYSLAIVLYLLSFIINYTLLYRAISAICFIIATAISVYKINGYIVAKDR